MVTLKAIWGKTCIYIQIVISVYFVACQGNGVSSENHLRGARINDPDNPLARQRN